MFRITQDPSSGSIVSYLIKTARSVSTVLVCAVGVWRHIQDLWCVWALRTRTRYSCQFLMNLEFSGQIFQKHSIIKSRENPSSGSRVVPFGWTDRLTDMRKLIIDFRNFANSPKNY
jgi:hypothetical protein